MSWWYTIHLLIEKSGFQVLWLVLDGAPLKGTPFVIKNVFNSPQDLEAHDHTPDYKDAWIVPAIKLRKP